MAEILVKCKTEDTVTLSTLRQFQGTLKKRSAADIDALIASIKEDGLLMPIVIWQHDNVCSILDGHARYEAFVKMAIEDPTVLEFPLPCIIINVEDEVEAKKALLQITSTYGHVTKKGMTNFISSIPNYAIKAPIVIKSIGSAPIVTDAAPKVQPTDTVVLKLRVQKDMVKRLTEVLSGVEGVIIL